MNSDFMEQQGELLARRIANEADNTARIQKAYRLIFGRAATDAEVKAGLSFLATEPLKTYEERRAAAKTATDGKDAKEGKDAKTKAADDERGATAKADKEDVGMMAGVTPGSSKKDDPKLLPPTPWGRYIKILLSSNEFLFID
jgi:hypothetical protein